jgi:hypothetical protein
LEFHVPDEVIETPEQTDAQAEADFSAGFGKVQGETPPAETKPETETKPQVATEAKPETEIKPQPEAPAEKPTLIAGMTEEQLKAALGKGAAWESEVSRAFGKIGEMNRSVQEIIKRLGDGRTSPRITAERLKRVSEELPGLGEALAADLAGIFDAPAVAEAKDAAAAAGKPFDQDAFFAEKVGPVLEKFKADANDSAQTDLLEFMHPDYLSVVKTPEFKVWLQTLSAERQKEVGESKRALVAGRAITEFKDWNTKAQKEKERSKSRLEGAITPKGSGASERQPTQDDEADFSRGFNKIHKARKPG